MLAFGIALFGIGPFWTAAVALVGGIGLLALGSRSDVALAACALLIVGGAIGQARVAAIDADPLASVAPGTVALVGELVRHPTENRFGATLRVRARLPSGERQLVEIRSSAPPAPSMAIGAEVAARGRLVSVAAEAGRPGKSADYANYLLREGVRRRLVATEVTITGGARGGVLGAVDAIRVRAERTLAFGIAAEPAALLRGMVLGGDRGLAEETVEEFRAAGLSHILAVSGQNVLLIVLLIRAIAMACGIGYRGRIVLPVLAILIYVPLCGAQPSVIRAGVMGLAALIAVAASRPASRLYALALAAMFLLLWNPRATTDVGAQLSFAAVLGIMAFTAPIARALCSRLPSLPVWMAEALAATFGATLATAPLMAWHFERVSLVSLVANVIATPLIGAIVWLGSLAAALGQLSVQLGALLNAPNAFVLGALIEIASWSAAAPGAEVAIGGFGTEWLLAAFAMVLAFAAALNGWWNLPDRLASALHSVRLPPSMKAPCTFLGVALLAIGLAGLISDGESPVVRPSVTMLSVGQGDAMLVRGAAGCDAVIDGGPDPKLLEARLDQLRVDQLDLAVITHSNTDHYAGLAALVDRPSPPRQILNGGGATNAVAHQAIVDQLESRGSRVAQPTAGMTWSCGDLRFEVLAPTTIPADGESNDSSVVMEINAGPIRVFAGGDAEGLSLLSAARRPVDVLKVPHHGSSDDSLPALVTRLRPQFALTGVGKHNTYGHPTPQAVGAISAAGAKVFRTDRDGNVTVSVADNGELAVSIDDRAQ